MGARNVAEAIGISVKDATLALHELRPLGYARAHSRRYSPTEKGLQAHQGLHNLLVVRHSRRSSRT